MARVLRPHQLEGVQFLYDCTTGRKADNAFGCIMADEMVFDNLIIGFGKNSTMYHIALDIVETVRDPWEANH